ncbi:MAG: HAMP domain-containing protein, partial [Chloroflexi bacterium]|nr:HAMP domain-containing protein [Chloroflexota bacterium]
MRAHPPRRPPWWPEGEPFPPAHARRVRGQFFWRFALFFALFVCLGVSGALVLFWFILGAFGLLGQTQPLTFSFAVIAFLFIILLFSVMFASRGLRAATAPLDEMIEAAKHVAAGDYTSRVAERGPREVRTLARAFNTMSARLQSNDEQRRQLMADVAHELRTPLTVMRGNLEAMLDGIH